ncbi:UDP-glucose/GDP-mannose dehydrogenase family protein [Candidatus Accumulibacter vicinus]|uniref:UDP-glucose 6-dehydrogenase n=1 Tax=Candidatus Accumulibacter vicinus TaxID=2954382 RepID=A0A084XU19_9PROT|nr:UDP-glucose/GDP-mannose dehydrogenase family protein [Candidatus Accumulibacter vicinus]KFB65963.1 MAG: UDP-glucose 6-dehydrogenase TuaD [Candidatus Accumulibacter vicinus]
MKVTVIGTGYVGLVTGACLSEMGNHVLCLDVDERKIAILNNGGIPIHEPGLEPMVKRNAVAGRLQFTTDIAAAVHHGTLLFIGVGTPPDEDGSADLQYVLTAARNIGQHMTDYKVIVDKSTVPVGTADRVRAAVQGALAKRGLSMEFAVVSNPEFLKEGAAVDDFMRPDRIIVGADDERATLLMRAIYAPFSRNRDKLLLMDTRSAELTKYAANAMLATRISFMNELARLAECVGADIELVRHGIGSDPRIGTHFLYAGTGYGGSCFPKDVKALVRTGQEFGIDLRVLTAVEAVNDIQKRVLVDKVLARFAENLQGRSFALWGLAFKPDTDDMRDAPSRVIVHELLRLGATIRAYDPVAMDEARRVFGDLPGLSFASHPAEALQDADALLIATEWREFKSPDFEQIRALLKQPLIFDGRNLFDPVLVRSLGIEYHGVGRGEGVRQTRTDSVAGRA